MGLRIYNLFPTLAGPIVDWTAHLERIAAMRFDWVYVNPIHATGGSGSLYAVADYYRLSPVLRGDDPRDDDAIVRAFADAARERGIDVMLDLVINHTANDATLVAEHPEWYARDAAGAIVAPSAVDPADPEHVTVWGDLAELEYRARPERDALVAYMCEVVRHYVRLGIRGFRCDAAYKVPGEVWSDVIAAAREIRGDAFFAAETLGCTVPEVAQLDGAGFDALFNSSKYWDFHAPWLLEQYEAFRHIAPSIAFPESHDTPRLAHELAATDARAVEAEYRLRYLLAATFSTGVMMPMGYEFGFGRALDVVRTKPSDWEKPRFDLSTFVAGVNAMKASVPAFETEGAQRLVSFGDDRVVALVRDGGAAGDALVAYDLDPHASVEVAFADLARALGDSAREVTPQRVAGKRDDASVTIGPREGRAFACAPKRDRKRPRRRATDRPASTPTVIERIAPVVDGGRFPIKRVVGDEIVVTADVFRDGHDAIAAVVLYRERNAANWREVAMTHLGNDAWTATFAVDRMARYEYTVEAWPDAFETWRHDTEKKRVARQPIALELIEGRAFVAAAVARADGAAKRDLEDALVAIDAARGDDALADVALSDDVARYVARVPDRTLATRFEPPLGVTVDRRAAAFSAWYEFFPRSAGRTPGEHGTFADAARRLPAIRKMGFDVVYLPPIHPIGRAFRKGRNNTLPAGPNDPGSPWAIGNATGGHTAIEPQLGTFADFETFVAAAKANGLEVALDYALQCSPDHPWVREHPEWFATRPDGSIKYAENPPKKYQDIVNFDWYGAHTEALWNALRDVVDFWIARGVTIFRVDNPHTKPFAFWEWMIADVQSRRPDVLFLAEAFTRPKVMAELAKGGFTQSYTYFTWRNTKAELTAYATELATTELAEYYRPNFFANTPDILPPYLQTGGRPAFLVRLVLAATLSGVYGIYSGFEICENAALPGREEYLDSEKYEIRVRDDDAPGNIVAEIARVNRIRRENAALADWRDVTFYRADDDDVIFYGKRRGRSVVFVAVNLDPFAAHETTLWFPTGDLGLADDDAYGMRELLGDGPQETWRGSPHGVRLDPQRNPAAIFRLTLPERPAPKDNA